jgi:DNA repair protein RadC
MVIKNALDHNASGVILCHNHPSGNLNPSSADLDLTKRAEAAIVMMDLTFVDHIIYGDAGYFSFRTEGYLRQR